MKTWLIDVMKEERFPDGGILITYNKVWVTGTNIDISRVKERIVIVDINKITLDGTIHFIKDVGSDFEEGILYKLSIS